MMDIIPSKETGFYYMVYARGSGSYFKCWIDGNENCELYSAEELIDIAKRVKDPQLISAMKSSFRDASIFIWMVDEGRIERLQPERDTTQVTSKLFSVLHPSQSFTSGIDISWNTQF